MVNTRKLKGEKTPTTEEEDRDTNLAATNENYVDTRDLIELGELDNAREEEMGELIALDMRVTALEEKAVDEKNKIVDVKNKMEALHILLASLEAYVEEVGDDSPEDSHEDVKEREKKGKGVKWSVHTLDDNLNKTMSRSEKEK
uniref:Uncharacterized protein n=1 Tax=Brassica oleracea TaxID=3712 RepID=A0A3P6FWU6_BRAOL|nr:unnamed protein product [Brassica oleracea]